MKTGNPTLPILIKINKFFAVRSKEIYLFYILLIFLFIFPVITHSQTITVKQDGTGNYTTLQAAIDVALDGDTILVWPGTYVENVEIHDKTITLGSLTLTTGDLSYINQTVIDGNQSGSCIKTWNWDNSDTVLINGFTLINGSGSDCGGVCGGGIFIEYSNINISDCIVKTIP